MRAGRGGFAALPLYQIYSKGPVLVTAEGLAQSCAEALPLHLHYAFFDFRCSALRLRAALLIGL